MTLTLRTTQSGEASGRTRSREPRIRRQDIAVDARSQRTVWCYDKHAFKINLTNYEVESQRVRLVAKLAEHLTPGDERWTLGGESPGSSRYGARYPRLLTGMICGWCEQPQTVEWDEPCPALMGTLSFGF